MDRIRAIDHLTTTHQGQKIFSDLSLSIGKGEKIGVVGTEQFARFSII